MGAWTDTENDAIVADYLTMRQADLAGEGYSKAARNRDLQDWIGRGRGSIEYKHQNVSAVLKGLGEPWIGGYKPAFNFPSSLVEAVVRALRSMEAGIVAPDASPSVSEEIPFAPAPTMRNAPLPDESEKMAAIARRFDVAEVQARNRASGRTGEERVLRHERAVLARIGRDDLVSRVRWVSDLDGDGAGYDIAAFEPSDARRLIVVKTNGWERPLSTSRATSSSCPKCVGTPGASSRYGTSPGPRRLSSCGRRLKRTSPSSLQASARRSTIGNKPTAAVAIISVEAGRHSLFLPSHTGHDDTPARRRSVQAQAMQRDISAAQINAFGCMTADGSIRSAIHGPTGGAWRSVETVIGVSCRRRHSHFATTDCGRGATPEVRTGTASSASAEKPINVQTRQDPPAAASMPNLSVMGRRACRPRRAVSMTGARAARMSASTAARGQRIDLPVARKTY